MSGAHDLTAANPAIAASFHVHGLRRGVAGRDRWAARRTLLVSTLLIMAAGCDPVAHEEVTLRLPLDPASNAAKSAVELINKVIAANGFTNVSTSAHSDENIAGEFDGPGRSSCLVYRGSNEIQIVISKMGRRSRPEAIKARDELKRRLSEKFGKGSVSQ